MPCLNQLRLIELDDLLWVTLLEILPIEIQIQSDCFWPGKFGNQPINLDEILISIEATHHWLIFKLTSTWQDGLKLLLMVDIPITIGTAQLQLSPDQLFVYLSD